ncbi:hypothetical protein EDC94DRAFT_589598 [Helicostylum pulchrum]|nr:hypothetical protein EDC94DRAFT_589598 [Helicostylum pulchrum]
MNPLANVMTITDAIVYSDRIHTSVNSHGIEILSFMARLLDNQIVIVVHTNGAQMQAAMQPIYERYRINALERSSVLRINVRGCLSKAGNYHFLEQPSISPVFAIVATDFSVDIVYTTPKPLAVDTIVVSDDEVEKDVAIGNNNIGATEHLASINKGPKNPKVGTTGAKHTEKGTHLPIGQTRKYLQYPHLSHPSHPNMGC